MKVYETSRIIPHRGYDVFMSDETGKYLLQRNNSNTHLLCNNIAAWVWERINGHNSLADIISEAERLFPHQNRNDIEKDVVQLIDELKSKQWIYLSQSYKQDHALNTRFAAVGKNTTNEMQDAIMLPDENQSGVDLSVCIVGYRSAEWDRRCIETLHRFSTTRIQICYIDNTWSQTGLSTLWNRLARQSDAPVICFLNPDVLVTPAWDRRCLEHFASDPSIGITGPLLSNELGHSAFPGPSADNPPNFNDLVDLSQQVLEQQPSHDYQHMALGSCLLIRRQIFDQIGGFPESVPLYFNDHCISELARQAGWKLGLCRNSVVWHMRQGTCHITGDNSHCDQGMKVGGKAYMQWREQENISIPPTVSDAFLEEFKLPHKEPLSICAAYKLFNAELFAPYSLASIYDHVEHIVIFLSTSPWNGKDVKLDRSEELLKGFPDPKNKIHLVIDNWRKSETPDDPEANEFSEMTAILEYIKENIQNATHYFYVDWDEVYHPQHLNYLRQFLEKMNNDGFVRGTWKTYWRSLHWVIEPPDPSGPLVAFPIAEDIKFKAYREVNAPVEHRLPPDKFVIHHYSYALPTWRLRQKLQHFSHCEEIQHNWLDEKWEPWAGDRNVENLHPVHPEMFRKAIPVCPDSIPAVMLGHPYYGKDLIE